MKPKKLFLCSMKVATALLLTLTIAAGLSACTAEDNAVINVPNVTNADVAGNWYAEYDYEGVAGEGENAKEFAKVVLYGTLHEDGSGMWMCLLVDAEGNAVDLGDIFLGAGCEYTVSNDGRVEIKLTGSSDAVTLHPQWTMDYIDGQLVGKVRDDVNCKMSRITEAQKTQIKTWMRQLGLGNDEGPEAIEAPVRTIDLSELTADYYAEDGDALTGTMPVDENGVPKYCIIIADGANIILDNVTIWGDENATDEHISENPAIFCDGDANITLSGVNNLSGYWDISPCIYVGMDKTLTIMSTYQGYIDEGYQPDQLYVKNTGNGAGIGGSKALPECGNIVIYHSAVYAQGGEDSPGIGSYKGGKCGSIEFREGCWVETKGGKNAVGIGCGSKGYCKNILIAQNTDETVWTWIFGYAGEGADAAYGHPGDGQCDRVDTNYFTIAFCSKEPTEMMYMYEFIKADYVSISPRINWNVSELGMKDGYEMKPADPFPLINRTGNELVI